MNIRDIVFHKLAFLTIIVITTFEANAFQLQLTIIPAKEQD